MTLILPDVSHSYFLSRFHWSLTLISNRPSLPSVSHVSHTLISTVSHSIISRHLSHSFISSFHFHLNYLSHFNLWLILVSKVSITYLSLISTISLAFNLSCFQLHLSISSQPFLLLSSLSPVISAGSLAFISASHPHLKSLMFISLVTSTFISTASLSDSHASLSTLNLSSSQPSPPTFISTVSHFLLRLSLCQHTYFPHLYCPAFLSLVISPHMPKLSSTSQTCLST